MLGPDGPWHLVANLPYNVATPLVADLLDGVPQIATSRVIISRRDNVPSTACSTTSSAAYACNQFSSVMLRTRRQPFAASSAWYLAPIISTAWIDCAASSGRAARARALASSVEVESPLNCGSTWRAMSS